MKASPFSPEMIPPRVQRLTEEIMFVFRVVITGWWLNTVCNGECWR